MNSDDEFEWKNQVLVLVNNRFGMNGVSEEYFNPIKRYMKLHSFVGMVGGQPGMAYYFVGHLEQPAEDYINPDSKDLTANLSDEDESSFSLVDINGLEEKQTEPNDTNLTNRLIFLDPHVVVPQVDPKDYS